MQRGKNQLLLMC